MNKGENMKQLFLILCLLLITTIIFATPTVTPTVTPIPEPLILVGISGVGITVNTNIWGTFVKVALQSTINSLKDQYTVIYSNEDNEAKSTSCMLLMKVKQSNVKKIIEEVKKTSYKIEVIANMDVTRTIDTEIIDLYKEEPGIVDTYEKYTLEKNNVLSKTAIEVIK